MACNMRPSDSALSSRTVAISAINFWTTSAKAKPAPSVGGDASASLALCFLLGGGDSSDSSSERGRAGARRCRVAFLGAVAFFLGFAHSGGSFFSSVQIASFASAHLALAGDALGAYSVAWEDGASEPVQLELRAGAPSAPGAPFALAGAQLCFVVKSTSLFRRRKPPPPLSLAALYGARTGAGGEAALADRSIALAAEGDDRSQREVVLEFPTEGGAAEALAGFRHALDALQHHPHRSPPPSPPPPTSPPPPPREDIADAVAELEKQLLLERANNQKMMLQMLEMQNDVNRGSAKIVELKQETAGLRSQLVARDRMHADDARMRLQLGKRLQQLVFDNAALRRTCDDLERHAQKAF